MPSRTEKFVLEMTEEFLPPLSQRSNFTSSRLAFLKNGTTRPVLTLLAERKFGEWKKEDAFPFWIDGDEENETLSNVALAQRKRRFGLKRRRQEDHLTELLKRGKAG